MTCACGCSSLSPFRFAEFPRPSMFMADDKFWKGAGTGKTMNAIATESVARFEEKNGRSSGTIPGLSDKADKQSEAYMVRKRAASHYRKVA